jgi:hypothetical protein
MRAPMRLGAVTKPDACRFCRLYAASVVGFALPLGAGLALQFMLGLTKFGGGEYLSRVLLLSAVRSAAAAVSGSALLLALVLWAHPLSLAEIRSDLRRILVRGLVVSLPGYAAAVGLALGAEFAVAAGFGQPWVVFKVGFDILGWKDVGVGVVATLLDAALIVFLAWRYLERLQAARLSLPAKLIVVVTFSVALRATVGLVLSSVLSG